MIRGSGPKKTKQHRKGDRKSIPFARVNAEIQIDSSKSVTDSRIFLNDLSPDGLGCFVTKPIDKGESVSIVIAFPKHLFVKGQVLWCAPYNLNSRVLSTEQYKYRVGISFKFDSDEERLAVRKFFEDLYTAQNAA